MATAYRGRSGESGILLLDRGEDALRFRAAMIQAAGRSIDIPFIFNET